MNYYNPYFYAMPNVISSPKIGLFSKLFGRKITLVGILNGTQRALNFANQAIPLVKQVKPVIGNAKTMFKVMNEFKKSDLKTNKNNKTKVTETKQNDEIEIKLDNAKSNNKGPTFFI